jgi:hypothetical protein
MIIMWNCDLILPCCFKVFVVLESFSRNLKKQSLWLNLWKPVNETPICWIYIVHFFSRRWKYFLFLQLWANLCSKKKNTTQVRSKTKKKDNQLICHMLTDWVGPGITVLGIPWSSFKKRNLGSVKQLTQFLWLLQNVINFVVAIWNPRCNSYGFMKITLY